MIILEWLPKDYVVMKIPQSHCQILYWCSRPWVLPGAWQCLASNGQGLKAVSGWRKALMPLASCSLDPNPMENLRDIIIGALQVFFFTFICGVILNPAHSGLMIFGIHWPFCSHRMLYTVIFNLTILFIEIQCVIFKQCISQYFKCIFDQTQPGKSFKTTINIHRF